jgi:hypothetical protein
MCAIRMAVACLPIRILRHTEAGNKKAPTLRWAPTAGERGTPDYRRLGEADGSSAVGVTANLTRHPAAYPDSTDQQTHDYTLCLGTPGGGIPVNQQTESLTDTKNVLHTLSIASAG